VATPSLPTSWPSFRIPQNQREETYNRRHNMGSWGCRARVWDIKILVQVVIILLFLLHESLSSTAVLRFIRSEHPKKLRYKPYTLHVYIFINIYGNTKTLLIIILINTFVIKVYFYIFQVSTQIGWRPTIHPNQVCRCICRLLSAS